MIGVGIVVRARLMLEYESKPGNGRPLTIPAPLERIMRPMTESVARSAPPEGGAFPLAWSHVDTAGRARSVLADTWQEFSNQGPFKSSITRAPAGSGRLDVSVDWPPNIRAAAETAAQQYGLALRNAFDDALLAAANAVSAAVQTPSNERHRIPLCYDEAAWQ